MIEVAVIVDLDNQPIYWHLPPGRTSVCVPDSRDLWSVIWEHRDSVRGIAHSHPGHGNPLPSREDVTTFAAIEAGLGRSLVWWITSEDQWCVLRRRGDDYQQARPVRDPRKRDQPPSWLAELRRLSYITDTTTNRRLP